MVANLVQVPVLGKLVFALEHGLTFDQLVALHLLCKRPFKKKVPGLVPVAHPLAPLFADQTQGKTGLFHWFSHAVVIEMLISWVAAPLQQSQTDDTILQANFKIQAGRVLACVLRETPQLQNVFAEHSGVKVLTSSKQWQH